MDQGKAKSLFAAGFFEGAEVRPYQQDFYVLIMRDIKQREVPLTFHRQDEIKIYRKVAAAIGDATRIGFEKITLDLTRDEAAPKQESLKLTG